MSFMEAELTDKLDWLELDTNAGIWFIPANEIDVSLDDALSCLDNESDDTVRELLQYTEGTELHGVRLIHAYGVRSSAPGYLDCTEWCIYTSKREAVRAYNAECRACAGEDY